jgi:transmembrane sensor
MTQIDEAAQWFAALRRGVMSLEERAAYEAWAARRENQNSMAAMENLWSMLDGTPKSSDLPRRTRMAIVSAICACSLVIGTISIVADTQFWTKLDWTNR